jgi:hypothetical protein
MAARAEVSRERQWTEFMNTRRDILKLLAAAPAAGVISALARAAATTQAAAPQFASISRETLREGRISHGTTWFHPRCCVVPSADGRTVFMTLQSISGSDYFGPVHWSQTRDLGKTWSDPQSIPGLGRTKREDGVEEGVCDVVPDFHAATRTTIAIGHTVLYKDNKLYKAATGRHPVYIVRNAAGQWSQPQPLVWDDPRGKEIYTCGCGQKVITAAGDFLIPISFHSDPKEPRAVATARCSFDGKQLKIDSVGKELHNNKGRGLLEPSMTVLDGRYYLTIRAEDNHGYVATSDDGVTWSPQQPWTWDDGSPVAMSTTQQHWLTHSRGLFLVYTRKDQSNTDIFRWRAPLYIAAVDREKMRLIRESEKILLPIARDKANPKVVAGMGNFHPVNASPDESWVTVGEETPSNGWHGDMLMARVKWNEPNRLA